MQQRIYNVHFLVCGTLQYLLNEKCCTCTNSKIVCPEVLKSLYLFSDSHNRNHIPKFESSTLNGVAGIENTYKPTVKHG